MNTIRRLSLSIALLVSLAGCASSRGAEAEPEDPLDLDAPPASEEDAGAPGLEVPADAAARTTAPEETAAPSTCPEGQAPLVVELLVLLRHPADPRPLLPADGFVITVDGVERARGVRVGEPRTLCVAPGPHEVAALGGALGDFVKATAPGTARIAVAGGGKGPVPGLPPGHRLPGGR